MTRPGTEPWSPGPLTNTVHTRPMSRFLIQLYVFTQPIHHGQNLTHGQLLRFSFSWTTCLTNSKEPSLPIFPSLGGVKNWWIHTFPKSISAKWNASRLVQDLNSVNVSISYDSNRHAMCATFGVCFKILKIIGKDEKRYRYLYYRNTWYHKSVDKWLLLNRNNCLKTWLIGLLKTLQLCKNCLNYVVIFDFISAQSAGTVDYTDCISAEE